MSTQLVSYNFSIVENPLSDGGNFTTVSDNSFTQPLKVIAGNLCEAVAVATPSLVFWSGLVPGFSGWPNDQYSEITLTHIGANNQTFLLAVRQGSASSGTQYFLEIMSGGGGAYELDVVVNNVGTVLASGSLTVTQGDVWRLDVTGSLLTISQNGSVVTTITDTSITSGSPGFGFTAQTNVNRAQTSLWAGGSNSSPIIPSIPTSGSIYPGTYMGISVQTAFSNSSNLDLMQVASEGGTVVWSLNSTGTVTLNPVKSTNGTILGRFLGSSFSTAFPNPNQLDVLQIRELGGSIIFHVDYQGNAHTP